MFSEPMPAKQIKVATFVFTGEEIEKGSIARQLNNWLQQQTADVVICDIKYQHFIAYDLDTSTPVPRFSATVVYGEEDKE